MMILRSVPSPEYVDRVPSNHLEVLSGNSAGHCSVRINQKTRIRFRREDVSPRHVAIVHCL